MAAPSARPKKRGRPLVTPKSRNREIVPSLCKNQIAPEDATLLDATAVSLIVGVPVKTLSDWRYRNRHLPYYRIGNHVRYDPTDVAEFLALHREEIDPEGSLTAREVATLGRHLSKVRDLLSAHPELSTFAFIQRGGLVARWL